MEFSEYLQLDRMANGPFFAPPRMRLLLVFKVSEDGVLNPVTAPVHNVKANFISRTQISCSLPPRYTYEL